MKELYSSLFADGLLSSLMVPLRSQTTFFAMKSFGEYDAGALQMAALVAACGAVTGQLVNFGAGRLLLALVKKYKPSALGAGFQSAGKFFRTFGVFVLLLSPFSLFGIFTFGAGLLSVRLRYAVALLAIAQAAYFGYYF